MDLFLGVISSCMFFRVILQLFGNLENNVFYRIVATVSEFFVFPFRVIMSKLNIMQNTPIDAPFFVAYIFVALVSAFLPII